MPCCFYGAYVLVQLPKIDSAIRDGFEAAGCKPGNTLAPKNIRDFDGYVNQYVEMYVHRLRRRIDALRDGRKFNCG
jgi:hypothetical protein